MTTPSPFHPSPMSGSERLFWLAKRVWALAQTPGQQSPEQWDALASRLASLGQQARPVAHRVGVTLDRLAAQARGRAVARPFVALSEDALVGLALTLSDLAVEWDVAPVPAPPAPPPPPPPLPPGVADFAAARRRRGRVAPPAPHGGGAA